MPFYKFKCDDCGLEVEKFTTVKGFENITCSVGYNTYLIENCEKCEGKVRSQIGMFNLGPDIYKNDPLSNQFWKKNKTATEVAGILADDNQPPY